MRLIGFSHLRVKFNIANTQRTAYLRATLMNHPPNGLFLCHLPIRTIHEYAAFCRDERLLRGGPTDSASEDQLCLQRPLRRNIPFRHDPLVNDRIDVLEVAPESFEVECRPQVESLHCVVVLGKL